MPRFTLTLALVAVLTGAGVLSMGASRADTEPEDRPLPRPVRLEYKRVLRACPDAETIEHTISAQAPRDLFDPKAQARLTVTITRQGIKYKATVEVHDAEGALVWKRPFTPLGSCDMLAMDVALVVGERFSLPLPAPSSPPASATPAPTDSAPLSSTPPPSPPPPPPSPPLALSPRLRGWRFAASGGGGLGRSPADVAFVTSFELGVQRHLRPNLVVSGSAGVLFSPFASTYLREESSQAQIKVGTTLTTGLFTSCLHRYIFFGWFFGCAGLELGRLGAEATKLGRSLNDSTFWAAVDPHLGVELLPFALPLPRPAEVAFNISLHAPIPLIHQNVLVQEGSLMHTPMPTEAWWPPPVAAALTVGLVAWFDLSYP